ncbi:MAG: DUF6714 family protein [Burkholderiaceae bacterium]
MTSDDPFGALVADLFTAFAADGTAVPALTLRGGDELDAGRPAPPFDVLVDTISDTYLEAHPWGSGWLDTASWRHVLPFMLAYALRHLDAPSEVTDAALTSLRPPDRDPPRLATLTKAQETVVLRVLDVLAHAPGAATADLAAQVLSEWWTPGAIPRAADED